MIIVPGKIKIFSNGSRKSQVVSTRVCAWLYRVYQMFCTYSNNIQDITVVVIG